MPQHRAITLTRAAQSVSPPPFSLADRLQYHEDDAVLHLVCAFTAAANWSYEVVLKSLDPQDPDAIIVAGSGANHVCANHGRQRRLLYKTRSLYVIQFRHRPRDDPSSCKKTSGKTNWHIATGAV